MFPGLCWLSVWTVSLGRMAGCNMQLYMISETGSGRLQPGADHGGLT